MMRMAPVFVAKPSGQPRTRRVSRSNLVGHPDQHVPG